MSPDEDTASRDEEPEWESPAPDPPSPGPDVPSVDLPDAAGDGDASVDPETVRVFWRLVLVFDVAILAASLGPMFVYFEGNWRRGLVLFAFGVAVFGYGVLRYRRFRADGAADDEPDADSGNDGDGQGDPKG